jgi:hypothetical protein
MIHKLRGGVSIVEQDTIENISYPIENYFLKIFLIFFTFILCNFLVPTGPKPAQISISVP